MRLNVIAVSLLALSLSMPAMAAGIEDDTANGTAGQAGTKGDDGGSGRPGLTRSIQTSGPLTGETGQDGEPGDDGEDDATNGTDAGLVDITTTAPVAGDIVLSANGGNGGAGGRGGNGGDGGFGGKAITQEGAATGGTGGQGGEGGHGGQGANGGAGGSITLAVDHAVDGNITLSATGGAAGAGGRGGNGGDGGIGGQGESQAGGTESYGNGGDGGDGHTGGRADGPGGSRGFSSPSFYAGDPGQAGAGGSITVELNAAVGGGLSANAGTGTISVTLNNGASVRDPISANEEATSALRFAMTVTNRAEYDAARLYLGDAANAMSGSLSIGGQTFSWTGFDQLIEALTLAEIRARLSTGTTTSFASRYLACSPRTVTAFYSEAGIELTARRAAERGAFRIGTVLGQTFASQNGIGWSVIVADASRGVSFDVLDAAGNKVATCKS